MNASTNSSNSDEYMDELNWTSDFATPGKSSLGETSMMNMSCDSPALSSSPTAPGTPPSSRWRRHGALKLFDTPSTPRSLLRRASQSENIPGEMNRSTCAGIKSHYQTRRASARLNALKRTVNTPSPVSPIYNPFHCSTPINEADLSSEKKRRKLNTTHEELDDIKVSLFSKLRKPVPVRTKNQQQQQLQTKMVLDLNQSRYKKEFREIRQIGKGHFGEVYQCQNRMDKWFYALKRLIKPIAGSVKEASVLREVYAHAVLGKHQHIVQYYSAWSEHKHMIIQNEYCNGGSLGDVIVKYRQTAERAQECDLKQILVQVSKGLRYMHSMNLVHLDIKPGNIFISHRQVSDDEEIKGTCYKIGDLGMVTSLSDTKVDDGDSRYIPREILDDDYTNLTKADVFSLSLTVYEVASLMAMPQNGTHWHSIRDGNLNKVDNLSEELFALLLQMIHTTPSKRPAPPDILKQVAHENSKICELTKKLNEEKFENQRLLRELKAAKDSPLLNVNTSRLVGRQFNRSMSIA